MKVILWMAISVNGIIAREDGVEDFLSHDNWIEFAKKINEVGCLIWGRKTYEAVIKWDESYFSVMSKVKKVIISHDQSFQVDKDKGFSIASSPQQALDLLNKEGFKQAILTGGATNNSAFAKAGLINEIFLNIEPVLIGKGITLFKPEDFHLKLSIIETKSITKGIIQLHYKVISSASSF